MTGNATVAVADDVPPDDTAKGQPPRLRSDPAVWSVFRIGLVLLVIQLLVFAVWNAVEYSRFVETSDYAGYAQSWYQIAHGHLDPLVSDWGGSSFLTNHSEYIMLLLAPFYWVWPHGTTLLWIQDLGAVAAEIVAFRWICEVAVQPGPRYRWPRWLSGSEGAHARESSDVATLPPWLLAAFGFVFLAVNPWVLWTISFDFHAEILATAFLVLAAYDVAHGSRRAIVWCLLVLACGDVSTTYLFGVGIAALLAGKSTRRSGWLVMAAALSYVVVLTLTGGNGGSELYNYVESLKLRPPIPDRRPPLAVVDAPSTGGSAISQILNSLVRHPWVYVRVLWSNALNIYGNIAPAGGIGWLTAWGFGVPFIVILEDDLRTGFSATASQNFAMYPFLALGAVMVLARVAVRRRTLIAVPAALLAANCIGWGITFDSRVDEQWLKVTPTAASVIARATANIPAGDEVIASHGISGQLALRKNFYDLSQGGFPMTSPHVWFVVTPQQGIELDSANEALAQLAEIAGPLNARLVAAGGGAYVFEFTPDALSVTLPTQCPVQPAWAEESVAGTPVLSGPADSWGMESNGTSGYVVYGDYVRLTQGRYLAAASVQATAGLSLQVWDADRRTLLAEREIEPSPGTRLVELPFQAPAALPQGTFGSSVFRIDAVPRPPHDQIEIRIYSPGNVSAFVKNTEIIPASEVGLGEAPSSVGAC